MSDKKKSEKKLTIATHFYNNESALQLQLDTWQSYPEPLLAQVEFIIVDDHSNIPLVFDIPGLDVRLYRVDSDIAWNQAGCRNLIIEQLRTDWALIYDVDHIISSENLYRLLAGLNSLNINNMYRFNRKQNGQVVNPAVNCYLAGSRVLKESGGYDEEFCGHYGFEDVFFMHQWQQQGNQIVQLTNLELHTDIRRTRHLDRDLSWNEKLLQKKMIHSEIAPTKKIAFDWHKVNLADVGLNSESSFIEQPVKLNLGKRLDPQDGYLWVAKSGDEQIKPDIDCDIRDLGKLSLQESVDQVVSVEVIEQFKCTEVVKIIQNWMSVLKSGGRMMIETPNLITLSEAILDGPLNSVGSLNSEFMRTLYGEQTQNQNNQQLKQHCWIYTPHALAEVMEQAGLLQIQQVLKVSGKKQGFNMVLTGVKP